MAVQSSLPFESAPLNSSFNASGEPSGAAARSPGAFALTSHSVGLTNSSTTAGTPPPTEGAAPQSVPYFVRHPRARRYLIRVKADGTIRVTIPRGGSKRQAVTFVAAQGQWILEQQARVARASGVRGAAMTAERSRQLRAQAARELPVRLHELAARFGVTVTRISIRNQRWRWGSCSRHGHICLNWRLVDMPSDVRDYVLIHELMHLRRMDHSPKFWAFVAAACPDYQQARRWLREQAGGLLEG